MSTIRLAVFVTRASPQTYVRGSSSQGLRSAYRVWRSRPAARLSLGSSSHEVPSPLGAFSFAGPPSPRVPPRGRLPPSGFRNLSAAFSLPNLAGLFHPASTCRLSPSRLLVLQEPYRLSATSALLPLRPSRLPFPGDQTTARLQGLAPPETATAFRHAVKHDGAGSPLGVLPLQGLPSLSRGSPFSAPPLTSFDARRTGRRDICSTGCLRAERIVRLSRDHFPS